MLEHLRWSCTTLIVLIGMVLGCFLGVVGRMKSMSTSDFRMVRSLLMTTSLMMLRRLQMVFGRELVMFGGLSVVFGTFVSCHL